VDLRPGLALLRLVALALLLLALLGLFLRLLAPVVGHRASFQGLSTSLIAPSSLLRNIEYASGAWASGTWCVVRCSAPSGSPSVRSGRISGTHRLTFAWPIRTWICRSKSSPSGQV